MWQFALSLTRGTASVSVNIPSRKLVMAAAKTKPFLHYVEDLMAEKSAILSKAQAVMTMGLEETAQPIWASAASYEERIAALLDADGDILEAAVHRISAASCFQKAGDPSRAMNLYRAALAGPLRSVTRKEVEEMLNQCLALLLGPPPPGASEAPVVPDE